MAPFRALKLLAAGSTLAVVLQGVSFLAGEPHTTSLQVGGLELMPAALAQSKGITYRPPNKLKRAIRTNGTGARGVCNRLGQIEVLPLVPKEHVGQTVSKRPTFLAYVAGAKSVEFALVEPGVVKPLVVKTVEPNAQGLVRVDLPETVPDLAVGKDYRWSVSVVCNPNRRSNDVFAQSWIQRVEPSTQLTQKLTKLESKQEQARVYAESGFWYDAIATLTNASQANPGNLDIRSDFAALLDQEELNSKVSAPAQNSQALNTQPVQ